MAANEERSSLWRTPLSTPVRSNENGAQDLFRHSEKLLASAVSICRLKGSLECQTGGIITVCEEMQRLLRLCFSENARVEKEMKKQKHNHEEEISLLNERVSYLEEEKESLKEHLTSIHSHEKLRSSPQITNMHKELPKQGGIISKNKTSGIKLQEAAKLKDVKPKAADVEPKPPVVDVETNMEEKNGSRKDIIKPDVESKGKKNAGKVILEDILMESKSEDIEDASLEISYLESRKASKTKAKTRKVPLNKVGKKTVKDKEKPKSNNKESGGFNGSIKKHKDGVGYIMDSDTSSKSRRGSVKSVRDAAKTKVNIILESPDSIDESLSTSVRLNPDTGLFETSGVEEEPLEEEPVEEEPVEEEPVEEEPVENPAEIKPKRNTKMTDNKKIRKVPNSFKKNPKENSKESTCKSKTSKKKVLDKEDDHNKLVCEFQGSGPGSLTSDGSVAVQKTPNNYKKESTSKAMTPEKEEVLGDIGFLIDTSSMLTTFMSNPDTAELELPLMSAKERADARKVAALFNLHISIGNKMENLSSLLLSKTSLSKMPKPGKLDNSLSQMSIAAAKEAERANSKSRNKRKQPSVTDGCNEEGSWDDAQPKIKVKNVSRSKKARL